MLLSAGDFVRLRTETHVFNVLAPKFGGLTRSADVQRAVDVWLRSDCHTLTGLSEADLRALFREECRGPADFLRRIMEAMGRQQGVRRWGETTPGHLLYMEEIARALPDALFVHVIRDGRDVAASMAKQGWVRPLPWDSERPALGAAAYWSWLVGRGLEAAPALGDRYHEVRYEDLVESPRPTLAALGEFIEHRLDLDEIQRVGIGSVAKPNSSFGSTSAGFIGRWRTELSPRDSAAVDSMLRGDLQRLGYESSSRGASMALKLRSSAYKTRFALRHLVKHHTPLGGRVTDLSFFEPGSMTLTPDKLPGAGAVQVERPT
jgi:hypothetical protein